MSRRALVSGAIEDLCYRAELDDEIIREIFWCDLSTFLLPKAGELVLVVAHDDTRIRAADEVAAVIGVEPDDMIGRIDAVKPRVCEARYRR